MMAMEVELKQVLSRSGKAKLSKWRLEHAHRHLNVRPASFGSPMILFDIDDFLLCNLHMSELGLPKTPWKFWHFEQRLRRCTGSDRQSPQEFATST